MRIRDVAAPIQIARGHFAKAHARPIGRCDDRPGGVGHPQKWPGIAAAPGHIRGRKQLGQSLKERAPERLFLDLSQTGPKLLKPTLRAQAYLLHRRGADHRRPQIGLREEMNPTRRPRVALDRKRIARGIDHKIKRKKSAPVRGLGEGVNPVLNNRVLHPVKGDRNRPRKLSRPVHDSPEATPLVDHTASAVDRPCDPGLSNETWTG